MTSLVKLLPVLILLQGCTWYGEFEHISSIPNGTPFNDLNETSTDIVWTGLRVQGYMVRRQCFRLRDIFRV